MKALQYAAVRGGKIRNDPRAFVIEAVERTLRDYAHACGAA